MKIFLRPAEQVAIILIIEKKCHNCETKKVIEKRLSLEEGYLADRKCIVVESPVGQMA